jgi:hypothetical protein
LKYGEACMNVDLLQDHVAGLQAQLAERDATIATLQEMMMAAPAENSAS